MASMPLSSPPSTMAAAASLKLHPVYEIIARAAVPRVSSAVSLLPSGTEEGQLSQKNVAQYMI